MTAVVEHSPDLPDYYARPPSYRCAINRTVVGSPSAFDTASVHLAATPQNVNHRFFLQAKCGKGRKVYASWVLCYATLFTTVDDQVFIYVFPVDAARNIRGSAPPVILHLSKPDLNIGRSKLFVASLSLSAASRVLDPGPALSSTSGVEVEEWTFAGFGLAASLDDQTRKFGRDICAATGGESFNRKGAAVAL